MTTTLDTRTMEVLPRCCPECGIKLNGATSLGHMQAPHEGDLTVCAYCGARLAFTALGFRQLTEAEEAVLQPEEREMLNLSSALAEQVKRERS